MLSNRSMPDVSVVPVLAYDDVTAAREWLCRVFGFTERWHIGDHRAQLSFGSGAVVVRDSPGTTARRPGARSWFASRTLTRTVSAQPPWGR